MKKLAIIAIAIMLYGTAWAGPQVVSPGGGGTVTDSNCNQAQYFPIGVLCQDTDDGKLYKGTGAAVVEIAAGAGSGDILADGSIPFTGAPKPSSAGGVDLGTTSAEWRHFYMGNGGTIYGQLDQSNTLISSATGWRAPLPFSFGTASSVLGQAIWLNNVNNNPFTIFPGATSTSGVGWRLPIAQPGGSNYLLNVDADGTMDYTDPATFSAAAHNHTGTYIPVGDIALGSGTSGNYVNAATATGGLTMTGNEGGTLGLTPCTGNEGYVLKWNAATGWTCQADATGGGSAEAGAYDAGTWDANTNAPTKDAVRDKIEALDTAKANSADLPIFTPPAVGTPICYTDDSPSSNGGCTNLQDIAYTPKSQVFTKCTTYAVLATGKNFPAERFPYAITITGVSIYHSGSTAMVGQFDECTGTGGTCSAGNTTAVDADITASAADTWTADDGSLSNPSIASGNGIMWHTTSVTGTNTYATMCFYYTIN